MYRNRLAVSVWVLLTISCAADGDDTTHRGFGPATGVAGSAAAPAPGGRGSEVGLPISTPTTTGVAGPSGSPSTTPIDEKGECGAVMQMAENMIQPVDVILQMECASRLSTLEPTTPGDVPAVF